MSEHKVVDSTEKINLLQFLVEKGYGTSKTLVWVEVRENEDGQYYIWPQTDLPQKTPDGVPDRLDFIPTSSMDDTIESLPEAIKKAEALLANLQNWVNETVYN